MQFCIHNGIVLPFHEIGLTPTNRAFLYGDGVFETMRYADGKLLFAIDHLQRLTNGAKSLGMEMPTMLLGEYLQKAIAGLAEKNNYPNARVRLTLYRESDGRYLPENNQSSFLITAAELQEEQYSLNEIGLTLGLFEAEKKSTGIMANHKTANALLYVLAAQSAQQNSWDDSLIINTQDRVIEATASNIFLAKGSHLHTPSLAEGPVNGVLRKNLLQLAVAEGFGLSSGQVTKEMLLEADEIILTNVITGIRWVGKYGNKTYGSTMAMQLLHAINKAVSFTNS